MSMSEQLKRGAEQSAGTARETLRKGEAKAQETMEAAQEGFQFAGDSARQMTLKLIEIMRANTEALCSFAEELVNERDPGKLAGVWVKHTQNQIDLLSKQGQELASLGQRITSTGVNTMSDRVR
jgi:hypothetical protein